MATSSGENPGGRADCAYVAAREGAVPVELPSGRPLPELDADGSGSRSDRVSARGVLPGDFPDRHARPTYSLYVAGGVDIQAVRTRSMVILRRPQVTTGRPERGRHLPWRFSGATRSGSGPTWPSRN